MSRPTTSVGPPTSTPGDLSLGECHPGLANPRGGLILPVNAVAVRPEARVQGFAHAEAGPATHVAGTGTGTVDVQVVNSELVPDHHLFAITFTSESPDTFHATAYTLRDSTAHQTLFTTGTDFTALGIGPTGDGLLPRVYTAAQGHGGRARTRFTSTSTTTMKLKTTYAFGLPAPGSRTTRSDPATRTTSASSSPMRS